jgi:hypothetical protein
MHSSDEYYTYLSNPHTSHQEIGSQEDGQFYLVTLAFFVNFCCKIKSVNIAYVQIATTMS